MSMFQKSVINKYLANLDEKKVEKAYKAFRKNYTPVKIEKIRKLKEEEYQDGFLRDLFVDALGYALNPDDNYNLLREFKNQSDGKKADGAILKDGKAIAVIELKSTKTKDLTSVTQQAFNYKNNQPGCKYVITSNFQKLRFYIDYADEHEEFDLFHLSREDFELFYLILSKDSVFADIPLKLKEESIFHEENVSKQLYKDYSVFKNKLFENLVKNNSNYDKLTLFKKSQKLIDRFLFILFAEDRGLLPPNLINRIITRFDVLKEEDNYKPLYDIYNQFFDYLNFGRKGKTLADDIPAYNGGLFYPDEILDELKIDDNALIDDLRKLSSYDFNSEVDVNILGHIFEHSLSEIEEITAELEGITSDKTKSKRKKDGVFYTPKYITQYIVENTIGTLCKEKRAELDIAEIEFDGSFRLKKGKLSVKGQKLYNTLEEYKNWLFSLKIVDPACGSGAFLNQALNFLIGEHNIIDDITAELTNMPLRLFDVDKAILENNLYGVDINEESIEIAKLSLWLHTAQKGRKLSVLSNNIKCGNSLIDDPEVAGDKAFNWQNEFPDVFAKGGFDVVIGNPPYGATLNKEEKLFLKDNYKITEYNYDTYKFFFELSINILKKKGLLGFITPNTFLVVENGVLLRNLLFEENRIIELYETFNVFPDAVVEPMTSIIQKTSSKENFEFNVLLDSRDKNKLTKLSFSHGYVLKKENLIFNYRETEQERDLHETIISKSEKLSQFAFVKAGVKPYEKGKGNPQQTNDIVKEKPFNSYNAKDDSWFKLIRGTQVNRYNISWDGEYLKYGEWLAAPRNPNIFFEPKIVIRRTDDRLLSSYDNNNLVGLNSIHCMQLKSKDFSYKYLLALINSKLCNWFFQHENFHMVGKPLAEVKVVFVERLPIVVADSDSQQPFIEKVDNMLDLNQQLQGKKNKFLNRVRDNFEFEKITKKLDSFYDFDFKTFVGELKKQKIKLSLLQQDEWEEYFTAYKTEINKLQSEISKTDKTIDQMVYKLYNLTEDEIKIVEEQ
jgi:type I restriction-modification system DNA methylase subunit